MDQIQQVGREGRHATSDQTRLMSGPGSGLLLQQFHQPTSVLTDQGQHLGRRFTPACEAQPTRSKAQATAQTFYLGQSFPRRHRFTVKMSPDTEGRAVRLARSSSRVSFLPFRVSWAMEWKEGFPSVSSASPLPGGSPCVSGLAAGF